MEDILSIAERNQIRARQVIQDTDVVNIWKSVGAEVHLVGSLKTGLLMKHRDIDFHIYSSPLDLKSSFTAMAKLAENPSIRRMEFLNQMYTDEKCVEWHAWYEDPEGALWQLDMIYILKGSFYDGYFEKVCERINAVLTPELRLTILKLKYETPETEKIMGIEYYQAVLEGGIKTYVDFMDWRKKHPVTGIVTWMP